MGLWGNLVSYAALDTVLVLAGVRIGRENWVRWVKCMLPPSVIAQVESLYLYVSGSEPL